MRPHERREHRTVAWTQAGAAGDREPGAAPVVADHIPAPGLRQAHGGLRERRVDVERTTEVLHGLAPTALTQRRLAVEIGAKGRERHRVEVGELLRRARIGGQHLGGKPAHEHSQTVHRPFGAGPADGPAGARIEHRGGGHDVTRVRLRRRRPPAGRRRGPWPPRESPRAPARLRRRERRRQALSTARGSTARGPPSPVSWTARSSEQSVLQIRQRRIRARDPERKHRDAVGVETGRGAFATPRRRAHRHEGTPCRDRHAANRAAVPAACLTPPTTSAPSRSVPARGRPAPPELRRRREALGRVFGERARTASTTREGTPRPGWRAAGREPGHGAPGSPAAWSRRTAAPAQHLIDHAAERVDVGPAVDHGARRWPAPGSCSAGVPGPVAGSPRHHRRRRRWRGRCRNRRRSPGRPGAGCSRA